MNENDMSIIKEMMDKLNELNNKVDNAVPDISLISERVGHIAGHYWLFFEIQFFYWFYLFFWVI